ncbi:hypothetical protein BDR07DRAFT_922631 [Suillus spraguei]|nr:hypothetical protein BDR07DRAFT_922631 [Suillus spraguei]
MGHSLSLFQIVRDPALQKKYVSRASAVSSCCHARWNGGYDDRWCSPLSIECLDQLYGGIGEGFDERLRLACSPIEQVDALAPQGLKPKDDGSRRTDGWRTKAGGFTNAELLGIVSEDMVPSVRANHRRVVITALVQRVQKALQKTLSEV